MHAPKAFFCSQQFFLGMLALSAFYTQASAPPPMTGMYVSSFEFSNLEFKPESNTDLAFSKRTFALNYGYEVGLLHFLSLTTRATLGSSFSSNEVDVDYLIDGETLTKKEQPEKLSMFYQIGVSTNFYIPQVPFLQLFGEIHYISYQLEVATYTEASNSLTNGFEAQPKGFGFEAGVTFQPKEGVELKLGYQQDSLEANIAGISEKLKTNQFKLGIGFRL